MFKVQISAIKLGLFCLTDMQPCPMVKETM